MRGQRRKAAVLARRRNRRIFLGRDEADVIQLQRLQIDGLLDQVAILVADMLELRRGHAHIERAAGHMAVTGGLEPGFKGLANNLLLECCENVDPGIERRRRRNCKCHRVILARVAERLPVRFRHML